MEKDTDLDLEIVEVAVSYALYMASLVNVVITSNKGIKPTTEFHEISKNSKKLRDSLFKCGIDKDIREDIVSAEEIMRLLQNQELMLEISSLLQKHHKRRHELIFLLTCVVSSVISGSIGGVSDATLSARSQAIVIGRELNLPESIINECFMTQTLIPLRQHLQGTSRPEAIEVKPGIPSGRNKFINLIKTKFKK
ncbi:hypothetical protein HY745_06830 [Candidatus Desantisbacteria bacterium]|nr:hypothetical protein [Candidatus Desantisbacteria bacterium]